MISAATPGNSPAQTRRNKEVIFYEHIDDSADHTLLCILVGCLMGLFSLVGVIASLVAGVLVGALAGYVAGRFMGTETSLGRNILMGILGSFVGEFVFGLFGIYATGSITSFIISVIGACICIWIGQRLFH